VGSGGGIADDGVFGSARVLVKAVLSNQEFNGGEGCTKLGNKALI